MHSPPPCPSRRPSAGSRSQNKAERDTGLCRDAVTKPMKKMAPLMVKMADRKEKMFQPFMAVP